MERPARDHQPTCRQAAPAIRRGGRTAPGHAYFTILPDPANPAQRVAFGTSGHRGSSFDGTFNEAHILAISQSVCRRRHAAGVDGPLFIGIDTHALPALPSPPRWKCSPPTESTYSSANTTARRARHGVVHASGIGCGGSERLPERDTRARRAAQVINLGTVIK